MDEKAREEPTWELVRKRNYVERLKHEKAGLDVIHDLPRLIARGYEAISEEDVVRLQWYGLYHDKPKTGRFMLRVKIAGGVLTPARLRTIGELSRRFGGGYGELTTRQNVQLHGLALDDLPDVFATLDAAGLTSVGGCGDNVRNITGCPLAGLTADELFDCRPVVEAAAAFFYGNRAYSDLPRKHKITIASCIHQCNAPEIHCVALVGTRDAAGAPGFAVRVGGGLSSWPRLADDLGVFVPVEESLAVLRAILDVWKEDLRNRLSRARARLKFMLAEVGPERFRALVEERLGHRLADGRVPEPPLEEYDHTGIRPQKHEGLLSVGFPVHLGLVDGDQMGRLADLTESFGGEIRLTRRQNFLLTHVPEARLAAVVSAAGEIGFPLAAGGLRGSAIACTGEPYCNFSVGETKSKMAEIVEHLERTLGETAGAVRLNLDGCPHACTHHWIGDIGLQGTTLRERGAQGERLRGYDVFLRGGLGRQAAIGRPLLRRVPAGEVERVIERLLRGYLSGRRPDERIQEFFLRHGDEDLVALGLGAAVASGDGAAAPAATV